MPRKSPRKSTPKKHITISNETPKQLVFILPDKIVSDKSEGNITFAQLKHPKTGGKTMYLIDNDTKCVCEVLKHTEKPRSWFLGNNVEPDGSLHVCTEINPLFLVLPYFTKTNKYVLLDQALHDEEFPEISKLIDFITPKQLDLITDFKSHVDENAYKFSQNKTLNWLRKRTERLADVLESEGVNTGKGARSATFVRSKKDEKPEKSDYLKYACGLISEYIDANLSEKLHHEFDFEIKSESTELIEPPPKRAKMEIHKHGEPTEDYSDKKETKSKPQLKKLTNVQKRLEKVDKTGMKNISSFFAKKK